MIKIHPKTLKDLEFHTVCTQVQDICITELGKQFANELQPFATKDLTINALTRVQEYMSSWLKESTIPNHGYDAINRELQLLGIEDSVLETYSFRKLASISESANIHLRFFKKFKEHYPTLYQFVSETEYTTAIVDTINKVIDKYGELKDDASPLLQQTRRHISIVKGKINSSFTSALSQYQGYGYLDEIRESVVDNIRVLAVQAMHRRKVKGSILGNSKTGSIVYIQPEATQQHTRELNNLQYEEKEEIKRILKALTDLVRPYNLLLSEYQTLLSHIDLISAKANYAKRLNAVLPAISDTRALELKDAYHPLLFLNNAAKGEKTYPQDIILNKDNRIIVISGPNAGGKSITLKTVGLLQVMLQSGLLIPVHEYSRVSLFNKILTDIGDNQSIENHLSTYSYRLKNMNYFLRKCDKNTLFLIDEFGTGSDPELGGALAETFLEVFHERESYGIITTHYANLKKMAQETEAINNANMLFDSRSLEPVYKLQMGEAGSSFTFEVAQKNGIPYSLINRSKKKVERGKIRFDKSIAKLQQQRSKLQKTTTALETKKQKAASEQEKLAEINDKVQAKLESYQELYDTHQRMIHLGTRVDTIAEKFFYNKNKKNLNSELMKLIQIENSKRQKQSVEKEREEKRKQQKIKREAQEKIKTIREKKKVEKKKAEKIEAAKPKISLKVGDKVRLQDGKATGTIDKIEKDRATVNYGIFTTDVSLNELEFVSRP
jgi:DNA mismatch repair protein MutS2